MEPVFGAILKELGAMRRWYEDDAFWRDWAPVMFTEERWAAACEEVSLVCALLGVEPPAHVLDLCCGPGRHSLEFARRGFRVTGVDRTPAYLSQAKARAAAESLCVEFVRADMRRFRRAEAFDGAVSLFTSFGYFERPANDRRVALNVFHSLKPGSRFVLDMMGKEVLARIFGPRDWHEKDGVLYLEERTVSRDWSWIENRWIMLKGSRRKEFRISHRVYSAAELRALLVECGFRKVNVYGDLAGSPYDQNAKRLVAVARR